MLGLLCAWSAFGQWSNVRTPGIPRTSDGKPDFNAKTPRTPDGKPDLSGLWAIGTEALWYDIGADLKSGIPLQPWAARALSRTQR